MERKPGSVLEVNQTTEVVADGYAKIDQKIDKMNQLTVEEDELFNLTQARVLIFQNVSAELSQLDTFNLLRWTINVFFILVGFVVMI